MATIAANLFVDWNGTTNGLLTVSKLNACLSYSSWGAASNPSWVYDGSGSDFEIMEVVDDGTMPAFPLEVTVNGTPQTLTQGKCMKFPYAVPQVIESAGLKFHGYPSPTSPTRILQTLHCCFVQFNCSVVVGADFNIDHINLYAPFGVPQQQVTQAGLNELKAHGQAAGGGSSPLGVGISITRNKWYFLQALRDPVSGYFRCCLNDPDDNYSLVDDVVSESVIESDTDTYVDYWGLRSAFLGSSVSGETLWGQGVIAYNIDSVFTPAELNGGGGSGTLNVTTANFTTLNVG